MTNEYYITIGHNGETCGSIFRCRINELFVNLFIPSELIYGLKATDEPLVFTASGAEKFKFRPYYSVRQEAFTCFPVMKDN